MYYAIKRIDQGGGYVAQSGRHNSYTNRLENAQLFRDKAEAERQCCGNEYVIEVDLERSFNNTQDQLDELHTDFENGGFE